MGEGGSSDLFPEQQLTEDPRDRDARVNALLVDYSEARDDERHFLTLQGTCLTLAITALTLLGALAFKIEPSTAVPDPALAIAPVAVVVILLFAQNIGIQAVDRSFYMRVLEREIRKELQIFGSTQYQDPQFTPLTSAEYTAASGTAMSEHHSRQGFLMGSVVSAVVGLGAWIVFGGLTIALALEVELPYVLLMAGIYLPLVAYTFRQAIVSATRGRERFREMTLRVQGRLTEGLEPYERTTSDERSLLSYLTLPRPDDVVKITFLLGGSGCAWLLDGPHSMTLTKALALATIFAMVIEFLTYQARYQWNDVRGIKEDEAAAHRRERGRLPGGEENIKLSLLVALARLYGVAVIVAALSVASDASSENVSRVLAWTTFLVFAVAVPYETLKARLTLRDDTSGLLTAALIMWVGVGYPLRFGAGWVAVGGDTANGVLLLLLVGMWGLGVAFVSMTWFLEGASYLKVVGSSTYIWRPTFVPKTHLRTLLLWNRVDPRAPEGEDPSGTRGGLLPFLRDHSSGRVSPWHAGTAIAIGAFGAAGIAYFQAWDTWAGLSVLLAMAACAPIARGSRHVALVVATSVAMAVTDLAVFLSTSPGHEPAAALLVAIGLIPSLLFAFFFAAKYDDLKGAPQRLKAGAQSGLSLAYNVLVGTSKIEK